MSKDFLDPHFSLFNCHLNNAKDRAKTQFILRNGKACWKREIQPFVDKGIMSIFSVKPTKWTKQFLWDICRFVNEIPPESCEGERVRRSARFLNETIERNNQIDNWMKQVNI